MAGRSTRRFRLGSLHLTAPTGDTLVEALARRGIPRLVRSVRYHRPRGPFCGTGDCTGCLVRLNGRPNVRACRRPIEDGDRIEGSNGWPSAAIDLLGAVDRLFPRGIDTLHGFVRPAWATRLYQRAIRRLAGYSGPPTAAAADRLATAPRELSAEVTVIGGGAAGAAAGAALVAQGRSVVVVDREPRPTTIAGATGLAGATATFLPPPGRDPERPFTLLGYSEPAAGFRVRSRAVVVATGGYDGAMLFEGSDRPGVLAAELALRLSAAGRRPPFRHPLIVGGGRRAAALLDVLGRTVVAVVAPTEVAPEVAARAAELDVPLYPRTLLLAAEGRSRVRRVRARPRGGGAPFSIQCDAVALAHRRLPNVQLFFQAGAAMTWQADPGAYFPRVGTDGATTVAGLFAAGTVAGFAGAAAPLSGARAADAAGRNDPPLRAPPAAAGSDPGPLEGYYRELLREPRRGKWIACPCEDVLLEEVEAAHRQGYRGVEVIKRYTALGTGLCQGRYCLPDALLVLSILEERPPPDVGYITQRPPVVPTPLAALAALPAEPATDGPS